MRDNPFLGQYTKDKEMRDEVWKVVSMVGNGMMTYQGDLPMEKLSLRVTTYWDAMSTAKMKQGKEHNFQEDVT
jgi:hypothetical protein